MHKTLAAAALVTGCICLTAAAAGAHHSVVVNFDQSKSVTVTGRIKELDMRNPHSQITLDVPPPAGGSSRGVVHRVVRRELADPPQRAV